MKKHLLVAQGLRRQFSQRPIGTLSCNHFYPALPLRSLPVPPQVCASLLFRIVLNYGVEMSLLPTAALDPVVRGSGAAPRRLEHWNGPREPNGRAAARIEAVGTATPPRRKVDA